MHPEAVRCSECSQLAGTAAWTAGLTANTPPRSKSSSRTPTFECNRRVRRRRLLLTYCGVRPSLFLRHTPPAPDNIFAVAHTPSHHAHKHASRASVPHHAQDRSHVPLEPRRRSPHPCKSTARFNQHCPPAKKHQTPKHPIKAREHVNSSTTKHHVKRELHLHLSFPYKAEPLPERPTTNEPANRPAAAASPPHKHRSPHTTASTPSQTARCLALRALRSASIPMAP